MEFKMQKNLLFTVVGTAVVLMIGGIVWSIRGGGSPQNPYAGVKGADLPTVVGQPSLGGPKIPFTETANYKEYTPAVLAEATSNGKGTLMYFYANWCGSCRAQEPINQEFFNRALGANLAVQGIRVNVDYNQPLMRQYGINYQHSYVLLNKSGQVADRFYGEHTLEELTQKAQQVL